MKKLLFLLPILLLSACNLGEPQIEVEVVSDSVEVAEDEFVCGKDKVKDADGNEYKTAYFDIDGGHDVSKDGQCWMAENLNVGKKILKPGETPSDDGVIEKWCMTDELIPEGCYPYIHYWGGDFAPDRPQDCPFEQNKINSPSICENFGGLYSAIEAIKYDNKNTESICPALWELPNNKDWAELQKNIRRGLNKEYLKSLRPGWESKENWNEVIPLGEVLKHGKFNGMLNDGYESIFISDNGSFLYTYSLVRYSSDPGLSNELIISTRPYKKSQKDAGRILTSIRCIKEGR